MVLKKNYPTVPPGRYRAKLIRQWDSLSKSSGKPMKMMVFEIENHHPQVAVLGVFITSSPKYKKRLKKVLSYLSKGTAFNDPNELIGRSVGLIIEYQEFGILGLESKNNIVGYFPAP